MARTTVDFAEQNTERAVQATNWMRAIAEQNLNQSKASFDGLLANARRPFESCATCEHSIVAAEQRALKCVRLCSQSHAHQRTPGTPSKSKANSLVAHLRCSASKPAGIDQWL
jgi:hypothetical protein